MREEGVVGGCGWGGEGTAGERSYREKVNLIPRDAGPLKIHLASEATYCQTYEPRGVNESIRLESAENINPILPNIPRSTSGGSCSPWLPYGPPLQSSSSLQTGTSETASGYPLMSPPALQGLNTKLQTCSEHNLLHLLLSKSGVSIISSSR